MTPEQSMLHAKTVALALYQIRVLLSSYLGSQNDGEMRVRQAAHLAYALHNEALAILEGGSFDSEIVARRLAAVDGMLGSQFTDLFKQVLKPSESLET
jgi:hypothetical protein